MKSSQGAGKTPKGVDPEYWKAFENTRAKYKYPTGKQSIVRSGILVAFSLLVSLVYFQFAEFGPLPWNATASEVSSLRLRLGVFGGAVLAMPLTAAYAIWLWVRHRKVLKETEVEMVKIASARLGKQK